jgi:hypothetical protein
MDERESGEPVKPPPAGERGPGYEFDEDGELIWFASPSFMRQVNMSPWYRPWKEVPWGSYEWPEMNVARDDIDERSGDE